MTVEKSDLLKGKKALITGGSRGLGYEIAREFLKCGADICICSNNEAELISAVETLGVNDPSLKERIIYKRTDMSNINDIDELYAFVVSSFGGRLDIVVNNAGIQGPIGRFEETDWASIQEVINVNLYGPMYSMKKAVPILKDRSGGSIVNISGGGATGARPFFMGYAIAKTGVVRATETLAKETEEYGIRINAVAPGAMNTKMTEEILSAGARAGGEYEKVLKQKENGDTSMKKAAKCVTYLASDKAKGITGRLISAVWDGWEHMEEHLDDISDSDIFTLRRIVPKDRGLDWE
jgi:3-oxoacyl-[acyl-carrier protein] reductase